MKSSLIIVALSGVVALSIQYPPLICLMKRAFRKYHRLLAIIISLPLCLTVLTGVLYSLMLIWSPQNGHILHLLMKIHTGSIVRLGSFYPTLVGLGVIGLLVTGLSLSGLLGRKTSSD